MPNIDLLNYKIAFLPKDCQFLCRICFNYAVLNNAIDLYDVHTDKYFLKIQHNILNIVQFPFNIYFVTSNILSYLNILYNLDKNLHYKKIGYYTNNEYWYELVIDENINFINSKNLYVKFHSTSDKEADNTIIKLKTDMSNFVNTYKNEKLLFLRYDEMHWFNDNNLLCTLLKIYNECSSMLKLFFPNSKLCVLTPIDINQNINFNYFKVHDVKLYLHLCSFPDKNKINIDIETKLYNEVFKQLNIK